MPRYAASISEMLTMPVGVLTTDYIDVWCNTATDTPHKIRVGDMIAVKWNADAMCGDGASDCTDGVACRAGVAGAGGDSSGRRVRCGAATVPRASCSRSRRAARCRSCPISRSAWGVGGGVDGCHIFYPQVEENSSTYRRLCCIYNSGECVSM